MKPSLQLKISQQLTMTPQLQQAIRLLQLSTLDLQQEIQETLESNPMLENVEESTPAADAGNEAAPEPKSSETVSNADEAQTPDQTELNHDEWYEHIPVELATDSNWDDTYQSATLSSGAGSNDFEGMEFESADRSNETLNDHLLWQLNLTPMTDLDRLIAEALIDGVAPDGYLKVSVEDVLASLELESLELDEEQQPEIEEVEAVLRRIQQFDPPGVAARDLRECLLVQLDQLPEAEDLLGRTRQKQARQLVNQHLALLGNRDFKQLMRRMKLKEGDLLEVVQLIQSLTPRPGSLIDFGDPEYVIPDVSVKKEHGSWVVSLNNDAMPKVRINDNYAGLVKRADNSADNAYLRNHLQEARWFIKSLQSRNETLLKVACKIVEHQQDFLDHGDEAMKPLVLADIAEAVEMHESTISRVTTQKYMHTPRGIFELKYFFSSHVSTVSGGECSSTAIRAIIKKLVAAENPAKPLSDSKIAALLEEQGIKVARRTIAKYREALQIPPSNERKRLV
ncbi:RNA polymerase factor sigma-54 [Motiliproteus coralliicola]|uniref:RNA polymerase sigma-54 factor n=1 Tax=Motiliproteus coralliicola TaxID=2283196 RepID=A0A369WCM0_9GAMM|nr:RNA polymerase factor sigma-54 [Motiliproteus coralliicola]RDE19780.1 RNA polymerase factor sigma-54 [Motiliproteus coralliicola]